VVSVFFIFFEVNCAVILFPRFFWFVLSSPDGSGRVKKIRTIPARGAMALQVDVPWLLILLVVLLVLLLVTVLVLALYSGLRSPVVVRTGSPPVGAITVAYKSGRGPYSSVGRVFSEATSIGPCLKAIGLYYDDPEEVTRVVVMTGVVSWYCDDRATIFVVVFLWFHGPNTFTVRPLRRSESETKTLTSYMYSEFTQE